MSKLIPMAVKPDQQNSCSPVISNDELRYCISAALQGKDAQLLEEIEGATIQLAKVSSQLRCNRGIRIRW